MSSTAPSIVGLVNERSAKDAVVDLLRFIGEDPNRDGLRDTPARVIKAWREMTAGYDEDPGEILGRTFDEESDELIVLSGISFYSTCEHHLLPFYGTACIGYLPGRVVGISKLARLVNCFARRLQIQERMTRQIGASVCVITLSNGAGLRERAPSRRSGASRTRTKTAQPALDIG